MEAVSSTAVIIALAGSFVSVATVNFLGARLEKKVQNYSHSWVQIPQRWAIVISVITFSAIGYNYYLMKAQETDLLQLFENMPILKKLAQPVNWFFRQVGHETYTFFKFLPTEMPLTTIAGALLFTLIVLTLIGIKGLRRWGFLAVLLTVMIFILKDNFDEPHHQPNEVHRLPFDQ